MKETNLIPDPDAPALIPNNTIDLPQPLTFNDSQDETLKANIVTYNNLVKALHVLFSKANSFGKALALIKESKDLIELRCKIMGHPYGARDRAQSKNSIVFPIDD